VPEPDADKAAAFDQSLLKVPFAQWSEDQKEAWVHSVALEQRDLRARRRAVLRMLEWRGIEPTQVLRTRLDFCGSKELLLTWLARASVARTAAEVIGNDWPTPPPTTRAGSGTVT
jgi:hypothetical protein